MMSLPPPPFPLVPSPVFVSSSCREDRKPGFRSRFTHLAELLEFVARVYPERPAIETEEGRIWSYAQLNETVERLAATLEEWGVGRGDRVGVAIPKSPEAVAAIHAVLRVGAAYVPVDPTSPAVRGATILRDAEVAAWLAAPEQAAGLLKEWPKAPRLIHLDAAPGGSAPADGSLTSFRPGDRTWNEVMESSHRRFTPPRDRDRHPDDDAYLLYTSGSTGTPKGVRLTHRNAFCFLDWCFSTLNLPPGGRFSSHAPFHFDLSVFDLYASCASVGTLVIVGEALGKDPQRLGAFLKARPVDVWYSAPSILNLLARFGGAVEPGFPAPGLVLFAGEVFPIEPLKTLRSAWSDSEMWNLYGPTETNVCTAYRVPDRLDPTRRDPLPIGPVCPPLRARIIDEAGRDVAVGQLGELVIAGPGVMRGYWNRPDLDATVFLQDAEGTRWYRTGDLAIDPGDGVFVFKGRRDRMVKRRGFRIELGEIEAAIHRHEDVEQAAAIARDDPDTQGVAIEAFVALKPERRRSIIAMKRHLVGQLPHYMIPDTIRFLDRLPQTSTAKVDYAKLKRLAEGGESSDSTASAGCDAVR